MNNQSANRRRGKKLPDNLRSRLRLIVEDYWRADSTIEDRRKRTFTRENAADYLEINIHTWDNMMKGMPTDISKFDKVFKKIKRTDWLTSLMDVSANHEIEIADTSSRGTEQIAQPPLQTHMTTFIGRTNEIGEVSRLLATSRLVTLTGPGGVGKTRLAVEVANHYLLDFAVVRLVDLVKIKSLELLLDSVAIAVGFTPLSVAPTDSLATFIGTRKILLVLDNCEHLREHCKNLMETLLKRCSNLKILATSRESLGIYGEDIYRMRPLSLPAHGTSVTGVSIRDCDAGWLFCERRQSSGVRSVITTDDAQHIIEICYRLEGIPLAIELAAHWLSSQTPKDINERLKDGFGLLDDGPKSENRQSTMTKVIASSYRLLSENDQAFMRRISILVGWWTEDAASGVWSETGQGDEPVFKILHRLADKSLLLHMNDSGISKYHMLEIIREYGMRQLQLNENYISAGANT